MICDTFFPSVFFYFFASALFADSGYWLTRELTPEEEAEIDTITAFCNSQNPPVPIFTEEIGNYLAITDSDPAKRVIAYMSGNLPYRESKLEFSFQLRNITQIVLGAKKSNSLILAYNLFSALLNNLQEKIWNEIWDTTSDVPLYDEMTQFKSYPVANKKQKYFSGLCTYITELLGDFFAQLNDYWGIAKGDLSEEIAITDWLVVADTLKTDWANQIKNKQYQVLLKAFKNPLLHFPANLKALTEITHTEPMLIYDKKNSKWFLDAHVICSTQSMCNKCEPKMVKHTQGGLLSQPIVFFASRYHDEEPDRLRHGSPLTRLQKKMSDG